MRPVLIDGRCLQGRGGSAVRGIGTYLRGLLEGIDEIGWTSHVGLLLRRGAPPAEAGRLRLEAGALVPRVKARLQPLADPLLVATALRAHPPRLYHAVEYGQPVASAVPVVVTVHDLIPFVVPGYEWVRRFHMPALRLLPRADVLIVPSRATADDCVRVAGVDPSRIRVIPHGVHAHFAPPDEPGAAAVRERLGLRRPYLLATGTFDPRKGIERLAEVAARAAREHDVDLVVTGSQGNFEPRVRAALDRPELQGRTHLLGYVENGVLRALYGGCAALVFTSAYEGFGLPVLEAMACGAPVVAFSNSSIPEVAGGAALLVDDGDVDAMANAVSALLAHPGRRRHLVELGAERVREHSWRACAERTVAVYRELLGEAF